MSEQFLLPPWRDYSATQLLNYFRGRQGVEYFAVLDDEQTTREKIAAVLEQRFSFNGESHELSQPIDWRVNPSADLEWLILLHKFYFAAGLGAAYEATGERRYADKWVELTRSWIDNVALDFLPSDVAGRRIQNWIFAHYYFVTRHPAAPLPADFYRDFLTSLAAQVNYLCDHLTPARNHRTLELAALFLAAVVFPEFRDAARWLELAKRELSINIQADLLPDGVHCELSTDYHHLVLKNYLWVRRLAQLNDIAMAEPIDALMRKALDFTLYVHRPDGAIPALSDGDSRSFLDLLAQGYELYGDEAMLYVATGGKQGTAPAERSKAFPDSGYYILRSGWGAGGEAYRDERYLIFDCGPLGRGNHGHFDLLSLELAAYSRSMIVDPGRYTYDESGEENWRVRFRGTGYHNTVQVDGLNQTRYEFKHSKFKITGPEPDWQLCEWRSAAGYDYVRGVARSHEYDAVHERRIFFAAPDYWIVSDLLTAPTPHVYDLRFHLGAKANDRVAIERDRLTLAVDAPQLLLAQPRDGRVGVTVEAGFVSSSYGIKHDAPVLRFSQRGQAAVFHTVLYPYKSAKPRIAVTTLPVWREGAQCAAAVALHVQIDQGGRRFDDYFFSIDPALAGGCSFGPFSFDGSMLFLRRDGARQLVNIRHEPGAKLIYAEPERVRLGA